MYVDERHAEPGWALLAWLARVGLAPLFLASELYYRFADSVAAARSDLDPSLPPDPVSTTRFVSDAMAARALLAALLDVVPDAKEVPPSPDWANVDPAGALRVVALSSPRLDAEQILVSWDEQVPARTFVWLEFEGLAVLGQDVGDTGWLTKEENPHWGVTCEGPHPKEVLPCPNVGLI